MRPAFGCFIKGLGTAVMLLFFVAAGAATYKRNLTWKNESALWKNVVKNSPSKWRGHTDLGIAYAKAGRLGAGMKEFLLSIKLNPYYAQAHTNMGNAYQILGRTDDAIGEYMTALELWPDSTDARFNLALAYRTKGLYEDAARELTEALRINPYDAEAKGLLLTLPDAKKYREIKP